MALASRHLTQLHPTSHQTIQPHLIAFCLSPFYLVDPTSHKPSIIIKIIMMITNQTNLLGRLDGLARWVVARRVWFASSHLSHLGSSYPTSPRPTSPNPTFTSTQANPTHYITTLHTHYLSTSPCTTALHSVRLTPADPQLEPPLHTNPTSSKSHPLLY